jgi:hypothetical protein
MPYDKPDDGDYQVKYEGRNRVPFTVHIEIDDDAWDRCDDYVQLGVINILAQQPIILLSAGGHGNGIKQEGKGLEFHTQTNRRLQCPGGTLQERTFNFTSYGRAYGH